MAGSCFHIIIAVCTFQIAAAVTAAVTADDIERTIKSLELSFQNSSAVLIDKIDIEISNFLKDITIAADGAKLNITNKFDEVLQLAEQANTNNATILSSKQNILRLLENCTKEAALTAKKIIMYLINISKHFTKEITQHMKARGVCSSSRNDVPNCVLKKILQLKKGIDHISIEMKNKGSKLQIGMNNEKEKAIKCIKYLDHLVTASVQSIALHLEMDKMKNLERPIV